MKKKIAMLVLASMVFAACGLGGAETAAVSEASISEEVKEPVEESVAEETVEASVSESDESQVDEEVEDLPEKVETVGDDWGTVLTLNKEATIEETVLYDENNVKITATGLEFDDYDVVLKVNLENNSDKTLTVVAESYGCAYNAINDFMIEYGYVYEDITPGSSANEQMEFDNRELLLHGITDISEIQIGFEIDDEDFNSIYTGPLTIPTSLPEGGSNYRDAIQSKAIGYNMGYTLISFKEDELYSSGGVSIQSEAVMQNEDEELIVILETHNDSDDIVYVNLTDPKVNETQVDEGGFSWDCITAGKKKTCIFLVDDLVFGDWEDYDITEGDFDTLTFTVNILNESGMTVAEPQEVTINL